MSINPASSSVTAISLAYISSPDDALDLSNATQSTLTDQLRESISAQVTVAGSLINKLERLNLIANHLRSYGTGAFKPVTPESLLATPKTSEAFKSLFDNSVPSLGSDLDDASATLSELNSLGISIYAPKLTPVLIDLQDKTGASISKSFLWFNEGQLESLKTLTSVKSTFYPDANERKIKIANDFSVVYTSFEKNAKLIPLQADINSAIIKITELAKSMEAEISAAMGKASVEADKIQTLINDNTDVRKNQSQQINALAAQQKEQVTAMLNKLRILRLEREASLQKKDNKIGPEISSIVRNSSDRVENIARVDTDILSRSSSLADAYDDDRRLQQSLTGLTAGPNINTSDNRIPV